MIVHFSTIQTMALAVIVFYLGKFLNNKFKFLKNNCIPDSVTGGTLFSFFILLGHETGSFSFIFEDSIKDIFMIAFFTTVGFSASIKLLKKAGLPVLMFLIAAILLAILQNVVGVGMAKILGVSPMIGLATGSLATTGAWYSRSFWSNYGKLWNPWSYNGSYGNSYLCSYRWKHNCWSYL